MNKIRVLIVDDSAVVRQILSQGLSTDPQIEIVGKAIHGKQALEMIPKLNPDVVTLDIEMPELNGLDTMREIQKINPRLPVIMCSTLTSRGAISTLDSLGAGASDYVAKPEAAQTNGNITDWIVKDLLPKVLQLGSRYQNPIPNLFNQAPIAAPIAKTNSFKSFGFSEKVEIVVIGISTGGPQALMRILPKIPKSFPVPILIVQHMPPIFTKALADRISTVTQIPCVEASHNEILSPGNIWIAPGAQHMIVVKKENSCFIELNDGPAENSCKPSVDTLFRSVAPIFGSKILSVIMTGMGSDGFKGAQEIKAVGGQVIAQDQATSTVWGMPGYIVQNGLSDATLSLDDIPNEIIKRVSYGRVMGAI